MKRLLLNAPVQNVIRIEISRKPGEDRAKLVVKNDVKITGELRTRGHFTKIPTTDIPDSANALFNILVQCLELKGFRCTELERKNLPKLPRDETDFAAKANIDVAKWKDADLRDAFKEILEAAEKRMAASRFQRKAGNWTDRKGGRGVDSMGL
jgi:hypothetical protein